MTIYRKLLRHLYRYPLSLFVIALIVYLSLANPTEAKIPKIPYIDKVVHFCMYAGLCSVLWFEYLRSHRRMNYTRIVIGAIVCPIIFSGAMEIAQSAITKYRNGDWMDFLANTLGVVAAWVIGVYMVNPIIKRYNLYSREYGAKRDKNFEAV